MYPNLKVHDAGYPSPDYLRSRVYVGDEDPEHVVFDGKRCKLALPGAKPLVDPAAWPDTPGSDRIVEVLLEDDPRPVYIQCWGGTNTAAKAFQKLKRDYPNDYERAVSKAVLYCIWYQDAGGPYIEKYHPLVTILLNHHFSGSWDYGTMTNTTDFVKQYMHNGKNPLGACYTQSYISEGDTPALLYMMNGNPDDATQPSWGGQFEPMKSSPYRVSTKVATDTVPVYGVWELRLPMPKGVKKSKRPAVPFVLTIDKQQWQASYADGCAVVRYAPKSAMSEPASNRLRYQLSSDIPTFNGLEGTLVVTDQWPGHTQASTDIPLGSHWFTDVKDPAQRAGSWQGAKTVSRWKPAVLHDWATRWLWLSQ